MKKARTTSYLTIWLILLQSFSMVANSFDIHTATAAQPPEYQHAHIVSHESIPDSQHNTADCHICGHCSGSHAHWINQQAAFASDLSQPILRSAYVLSTISSPVNPLLRPPKA